MGQSIATRCPGKEIRFGPTGMGMAMVEAGYDIRTIQELLGHTDVRTTMIYTHVLNRGPGGIISPEDRL
jgi:integrase